MSNCRCSVCQCPVDCGDIVCGICECQIETCTDGLNCEKVIKEVQPGLFLIQLDNGSYSLKWKPGLPST